MTCDSRNNGELEEPRSGGHCLLHPYLSFLLPINAGPVDSTCSVYFHTSCSLMHSSFAVPLRAGTGKNTGSSKFKRVCLPSISLPPRWHILNQRPFPRLQAGGRRKRADTHTRSLVPPQHRSAVPVNYSRAAPSYTSFELQTGKRSIHACLYKEIRAGCI